MATSGGVADLRSVLVKLRAVPDEAVADVGQWFVPRSEQVGGRMMWFGKRVKLTAKIKTKSVKNGASVLLVGTPVSCWSIKSYGRRGGYPVKPRRKEALSIKAFAPGAFFAHVTVRSGTTGDRRWERLAGEVEQRFPAFVDRAIDRVVR